MSQELAPSPSSSSILSFPTFLRFLLQLMVASIGHFFHPIAPDGKTVEVIIKNEKEWDLYVDVLAMERSVCHEEQSRKRVLVMKGETESLKMNIRGSIITHLNVTMGAYSTAAAGEKIVETIWAPDFGKPNHFLRVIP